MVWDSNNNNVPVKTIKDRIIRWKKFFDSNLNRDTPFVVLDITKSLIKSYACNREPPGEQKMFFIQKFKTNKIPRGDSSNSSNVVHRISYHI